ncbi:MAG: DUF3021 domain-containing protein [Oscillospiraceae bacterium]|nr:DUF3021 domain-containing protein [Oscillospiraceae bacterium]
MKKIAEEFFRRGLLACGLGPLVLVVLYLVLQHYTGLDNLTVNQVCTGILSLSALSFISGGMNVVYQIEQLPLMTAILIHGTVLYIGYLATYLLNNWLELGITPVLVFTAVFVAGYFAIWAVIYFTTKKNTENLNKKLREKQKEI